MEKGNIVYTVKEFVAWCECGEMEVLHFKTKHQALAAFRESGWRVRRGKWICEKCASRKVRK